jgi:hypothetical protein
VQTTAGGKPVKFAPGIRQLRKAVEQQDARPALVLEPGLQHVHAQAVDVLTKRERMPAGNGISCRTDISDGLASVGGFALRALTCPGATFKSRASPRGRSSVG